MSAQYNAAGFQPIRHDRLIQEQQHDTYKSREKLPEPTACPQCGAVYHDGHWQWLPRPAQAHEAVCPACHRIHDNYPAGFVHLGGAFLDQHRDEILHLLRHEGEREQSRHPLERIMATETEDSGVLVTTTGIHLARRLGEAVHNACQGTLEFHYNDAEKLLRVHWQR